MAQMAKTDQIIDTKHDYMALIYDHVIEKNTKKLTIYDKIRNHYNELIEKLTKKIQKSNLYLWVYDYIENMTQEEKNEAFQIYGHLNILNDLPQIAQNNCWTSYEAMVEEEGDMIETYVLIHIIKNVLGEDAYYALDALEYELD
jgi:hypothetical protein